MPNESSAACVCAEINTRHCPVHGQGETTAASSCGLRAPGGFGEGCELPAGHDGFHYAKVGCGSSSWPNESSASPAMAICPECGAVVSVCEHLRCIPKFHSPSDEGKAPAAAGQNSQRRSETGSGFQYESVESLEADRDRLAMALERIARGAEYNPAHEISEIAWEALRDA